MTATAARRWLVWIALALGTGAAVVGTPAHHAFASRRAHSAVLRGC